MGGGGGEIVSERLKQTDKQRQMERVGEGGREKGGNRERRGEMQVDRHRVRHRKTQTGEGRDRQIQRQQAGR